jgi:6-phosphofructokinase 1
MLSSQDLSIASLGPAQIPSPLHFGAEYADFVSDETKIRFQVRIGPGEESDDELFFELAGPRARLFFNPSETRAAIVTCGGLCPGLNNVIRSTFLALTYNYGVCEVFGIRYGYHGFNPELASPVRLTHEQIENVHMQGGTFLGSSRGPESADVILGTLDRHRINVVFCVGGDGTQRGAHAIAEEARRRGKPLAVVGIPKTIDNDIPYVWQSFGYSTALEKAREVLSCAHAEAKGAPNGISIVKLMGRDAGFIAAGATTASQDVNFTLIPEVPFDLDGPNGFLAHLEKRMEERKHAVIVVAEGAGQHLFSSDAIEYDASGNVRQKDIGLLLKSSIESHFKRCGKTINLKYIDPSYIIRSVPANCDDSTLCDQFARHAVHAAMAGKTDMLIGLWYNNFIHVPISLVASQKKCISPKSGLWGSVLAATGQPARMTNDAG